jgi:hypothetical protein
MSVQTARFRIPPRQILAVTEQIEVLFAAVHAAAPPGMRYTVLRENDGAVFTLILELTDGVDNPLPSIPAAAAFRSWLASQTDDDVTPRACTVLGRYSA